MTDVTAFHRVVFTPSGLEGKVATGTSVLDAARQLGADLDTVCGGRGICGRCQVTPSLGRFAKWGIDATPDALSAPAAIETDYHANRPLEPGNRLGCAARIHGDVVVDVPAASQVHRQVVRKDLDLAPVTVDPSFRLYYVEVPAARLGDGTTSAAGALADAVAGQHGVARPGFAAALLPSVHRVLAAGDVTVALHGDVIVAIWAGYVDTAYGVAVDVGSTTVAGHLCDLSSGEVLGSAGRMNPQIRFGEDLMSRVSYVMMNPGGDKELTDAVRRAIDELVGELLDGAGADRAHVLELVLVGNPIMHHIALGIDPTPLGSAPFVLATDEAVTGPAAGLDLDLPYARFYAGPCIAGHVGADTAAAILAEGPHRAATTQLLVDVGTNAEIVLGDRHRLFAASSPTGPAFEGAQISCGQRATAGAIERVRIDPETLEPELGIIGDGAVGAGRARERQRHAARAARRWGAGAQPPDVNASRVTGVCGSGIIDAVAEMSLVGIIDAAGTIRGEAADRTSRIVSDGRTFAYVLYERDGVRLTITQNDVRAIQLAKAALRAGIELLLEHAGRPEITDIRLAGAFGAHIDPYHAIVLGLVPDVPVERVHSVGNSAGAGAVYALLSRERRAEMEDAVRDVVKIETATEPRFQELFVAAMAFPYGAAPAATPRRRRGR
jgi:uncharacterized 2Fe-2S/4Fe-4S cluster protein (DUF4445 family)